jgi:hypothetical protein
VLPLRSLVLGSGPGGAGSLTGAGSGAGVAGAGAGSGAAAASSFNCNFNSSRRCGPVEEAVAALAAAGADLGMPLLPAAGARGVAVTSGGVTAARGSPRSAAGSSPRGGGGGGGGGPAALHLAVKHGDGNLGALRALLHAVPSNLGHTTNLEH